MPSRADALEQPAQRRAFSVAFMPAAGSSSASSLRLGGERARDLEAALVAVGEVLGERRCARCAMPT